MTIDRMDLMALIEKGADSDFLREMIEVISNRLMEMEVEGLTGAALGERSASRTNSATAIANARGRRASAPSISPSRSSGRAATSQRSWSRGVLPKRR
jgi:hypothetical protein